MMAGMAALVPGVALGQGTLPRPRPGDLGLAPDDGAEAAAPLRATGETVADRSLETVEQVFGRSRLGDVTGFMVTDLGTGRILESHQPYRALPPASVAKAITAVYALQALGPDHRFVTRLLATGPLRDGRIQGDLILAGGGDPALDTDGLMGLVQAMRQAGVFGVAGRFLIHDAALPYAPAIDPGQPDHVGYNPAVSGLNLNFNRVYFQWRRGGSDLAMLAQGQLYAPAVHGIRIGVDDRSAPVFRYRREIGGDSWSVARAALGRDGSRWLPVRAPGDYAGETFRALAFQEGVRLPDHARIDRLPQGAAEIASAPSATLAAQLREMLKWSTNLTAEVAGLAASRKSTGQALPIPQSAEAMTQWFRRRYGLSRARFVNHSGLTAVSEMTPAEMVQYLDIEGQEGPLPGMMKEHQIKVQGGRGPVPGVTVRAKTGTLNFTRGLAGYITGPGAGASGRRLAFAIFAADLKARAGVAREDAEDPAGSDGWIGRALGQEQALLHRWARSYAAGA